MCVASIQFVAFRQTPFSAESQLSLHLLRAALLHYAAHLAGLPPLAARHSVAGQYSPAVDGGTGRAAGRLPQRARRGRDERGRAGRREQQIGGSGGSLEPPGPLLEPPGPLLTHLYTVCIAYSECLPTRLSPLAERTCFSQVPGLDWHFNWYGTWMLTQGGQGGRPAPLATRLHRIPSFPPTCH